MTLNEEFILKCRNHCRLQNACRDGYAEILRVETIPQVMQLWRKYFSEFLNGGLYDTGIPTAHLSEYYDRLKDEINAARVYYNECPEHATSDCLVFVGDSDKTVNLQGCATCLITGSANVVAHGQCRIICKNSEAKVCAYDHCYGTIEKGELYAHDDTDFVATSEVWTYDRARVSVKNAVVHDYGHKLILALDKSKVYSFTHKKIVLEGESELIIENR